MSVVASAICTCVPPSAILALISAGFLLISPQALFASGVGIKVGGIGTPISPGPERRILLLNPAADNSLLAVSGQGILAVTLVEGSPSTPTALIVGETTA